MFLPEQLSFSTQQLKIDFNLFLQHSCAEVVLTLFVTTHLLEVWLPMTKNRLFQYIFNTPSFFTLSFMMLILLYHLRNIYRRLN